MKKDWIEQLMQRSLDNIPIEQLEKLSEEQVFTVLKKSYPTILSFIEEEVERNSGAIVSEHQQTMSKFRNKLFLRWKKPLNLLEKFILYNREFGETVLYSYREDNGYDVRIEVIARLHARACQVALEVLHLLSGGFANGALARWRTIHELAVTANFLEDKPIELFQKYLDYSRVETFSEAEEYQKNCESLGYSPLSRAEFAEHTAIMTQLETKYGEGFTKNYGWTEGYLHKKKMHFRGMEETVHFKDMRSFYKLANNYVHGGSKGLLFDLSTIDDSQIMLAGPSNYGLADPGQNTAQSLLFISMIFLNFESYIQRTIHLDIAGKMLGELSLAFVNVQRTIEAEEIELKRIERGLAYRLSKRKIVKTRQSNSKRRMSLRKR